MGFEGSAASFRVQIIKYSYYMETDLNKELYEAPTVEVVEVKAETAILQASKPDYIPDTW